MVEDESCSILKYYNIYYFEHIIHIYEKRYYYQYKNNSLDSREHVKKIHVHKLLEAVACGTPRTTICTQGVRTYEA